jgi:hypothetical protein
MKWVLGAALVGAWLVACGSGSKSNTSSAATTGDTTDTSTGSMGNGGATSSGATQANNSSAATTASQSATGSGTSSASSSASGGVGCQKPIFNKVVSNMANPSMQGTGFGPVWGYNAQIGLAAGKAMCQAVGADHVCTYADIQAADANGELANLPTNLTYWLHRTSPVMDTVQGSKTCDPAKNDANNNGHNPDCDGGGITADTCEPMAKICVFRQGAGARCNDWTYATNHISNGEWFQPAGATTPNPGGVKCGDALCTKTGGSLLYHFDRNAAYNGTTLLGCKADNMLGCSGACMGPTRAILCCNPC